MLDEFVAMTGCHRKHAVRLLGQVEDASTRAVPRGRRIYDEAVREALTLVREASDMICGKRLKAALPSMVESLERYGHLDLDPDVRLHDTRHAHATILLAAGVPLKVVQERLGHSTIATMADIYSHVLREMDIAAAEAFESQFDNFG